jgi:hypothetical protein
MSNIIEDWDTETVDFSSHYELVLKPLIIKLKEEKLRKKLNIKQVKVVLHKIDPQKHSITQKES